MKPLRLRASVLECVRRCAALDRSAGSLRKIRFESHHTNIHPKRRSTGALQNLADNRGLLESFIGNSGLYWSGADWYLQRHMMPLALRPVAGWLTALLLLPLAIQADKLADTFQHPPPAAKPWVYWFFLDGNLSRQGITADLEAMQRAGIGGVILMEVDAGIPKGPVKFMSAEWRALFKHAVLEAERLGLEMSLNAGPGWTGSGGPWVKAEQSMQHLVASETNIVGGRRFEGVLAVPPPREPFFGPVPADMEPARQKFYRDVAVLAVPNDGQAGQITDLDEKALYVRAPYSSQPGVTPYLWPTLAGNPQAGMARNQVVDLTDLLSADGRLVWDAPPGNWTVLRFGRRTTGANTRPAPQPALGFESDKFDRAALAAHFDDFVGVLLREIGPRPMNRKAGWTMLHIDSWEMGAQNWTGQFRAEFWKRRGYDPLPWLPVMTGRIVNDRAQSERFLWDLRQTAQELVIENHAQYLKELGQRYGFKLSIEPYDMNPCADLSLGGVADIPMCEFWAQGYGFETAFCCLEAASIAHTLGRPIVAAESFTSDHKEAWRLHPGAMKPQADWAFCVGINRLVIHRYAHQPWLDRWPGMTMGPYGVHYERTQTWWNMVGAWHQYLARCQALLQSGQTVADICYLAPEGAPLVWRPPASALQGQRPLPDRKGYNFDGCAPEVLMKATVKNGQLVLPSGVSYRVLVLPETGTMTPALLRKIRDLTKAGATVVGLPPQSAPGLSGYPQCDEEVRRLAGEMWGGKKRSKGGMESWRVGKGRMVTFGQPVARQSEATPQFPSAARWIWHAEGNPAASAPVASRRFRRIFQLPAGATIKSAQLLMTADNSFAAQLNGQEMGSGDNFHLIYSFDAKPALKAGANELTVLGENGGDTPNPAGLIGALLIRLSDGREITIATDRQWESAEPDKVSWQAVVELGAAGMAPWGKFSRGGSQFPEHYTSYDNTARLLAQMGVPPDFESDLYVPQHRDGTGICLLANVHLRYIHLRDGDADIYFLANPASQPVSADCKFRVAGKKPEIWDPHTGLMRRVAYYDEQRGCTEILVNLDQGDSVFVVFQRNWQAPKPPSSRTSSLITSSFHSSFEIRGPWELHFQPGRGAPEKIPLDQLMDLSQHAEPGVKYFSGEMTYRTTFALNSPLPLGGEGQGEGVRSAPVGRNPICWLDLGKVSVIARVKVNGQDLGVLWKAPFGVNISSAIKPGENTLEITVANLWGNRLIGDAQLPADAKWHKGGNLAEWPDWLRAGQPSPAGRIAFTTWQHYQKDAPLPVSGLLGPVVVRVWEK